MHYHMRVRVPAGERISAWCFISPIPDFSALQNQHSDAVFPISSQLPPHKYLVRPALLAYPMFCSGEDMAILCSSISSITIYPSYLWMYLAR